MKMAVTSTGNQLQSKFDLRFGRSAWFCVFDTDTEGIEFIENDGKNANGGAGTKAAEKNSRTWGATGYIRRFWPQSKSVA